jgi:hypothetical protein
MAWHAVRSKVRIDRRWGSLVIRVVIALLLAWLLAVAPVSSIAPQKWVAFVQVPIVVFFLVCYLGKVIVDTLFFDHYKS